jgi:antitoxin MazE
MRTKVQKWGNSLALRIPRSSAREMNVAQGSQVEVTVKNGSLLVTPLHKPARLEELLRRVTPENVRAERATGRARGREV